MTGKLVSAVGGFVLGNLTSSYLEQLAEQYPLFGPSISTAHCQLYTKANMELKTESTSKVLHNGPINVKNDFKIIISNDGSSNLNSLQILYHFLDEQSSVTRDKMHSKLIIQRLEVSASSNRLASRSSFNVEDDHFSIEADALAKTESLLISGVLSRPAIFYAEITSKEKTLQKTFFPNCDSKSIRLFRIFSVGKTYYGTHCKPSEDEAYSCEIMNSFPFSSPQVLQHGMHL